MGKPAFDRAGFTAEVLQFIERNCLGEGEGAGLRSSQRSEVRAAMGHLAELMGDGADITSSGNLHFESRDLFGRRGAFEREQLKSVNQNAGGLYFDGFAGASEFVRGYSADFFGGEDRRRLQHFAMEVRGQNTQLFERERQRRKLAGRSAFGVEAIGGIA